MTTFQVMSELYMNLLAIVFRKRQTKLFLLLQKTGPNGHLKTPNMIGSKKQFS